MTAADGAVVLNAEDELVAGIARVVRAPVWWFSTDPRHPRVRRAGRPGARIGARAFVLRDETIVELDADGAHPLVAVTDVPATLGGAARHNVANALAAAAGARAMGATREDVGAGLRGFRPDADQAPGRLNLYGDGRRTVIVDFAHNDAGLAVALDTARRLAGRIAPDAPVVVIIGTAGDRPDDTLRAVGRVAAQRADAVTIKESLRYLRGRTRDDVIGELRTGLRSGGMDTATVPVHLDEVAAVRAELTDPSRPLGGGAPGVLLVMTHEQRTEVASLLAALGFTAL